jgi:hypothetical protein
LIDDRPGGPSRSAMRCLPTWFARGGSGLLQRRDAAIRLAAYDPRLSTAAEAIGITLYPLP